MEPMQPPPRPEAAPSVAMHFAAAVYLRRKLLLWIWVVALVVFVVVAAFAKKRYTSSVTFQIKEETASSGLGLGDGLKMLGARFNSDGTGTTLAVLESRELAMTIIRSFRLKEKYDTKWDHLAIKKFQSNFTSESFDEGIVQMDFTDQSRDSSKIILDSILSYVNRRSIEYSTSKARHEFAFNRRQVDSVYNRMDSLNLAWTAFMRKHGMADLKSNVQLALSSYGAIDQALIRLEEKHALAKIDNRVPPQERRNLETQIEALKLKRRALLMGSRGNSVREKDDYEISILYDSIPTMLAWQERLEFMAEKDKLILKILIPKLEESRLKMVETTPVINIIDPSFIPPYKSGPKRSLIVIGGTLLSGIFLTLLVVVREWYRNPAFEFPIAKGLLSHVRRFR